MVKPDKTALSCYFLVRIADHGHKMGFKTRMVQILQKTIESESVSRGQVDRAQNEKDGSDFEEDGTAYWYHKMICDLVLHVCDLL